MENTTKNITFPFEAHLIELQRYDDERGSLFPIEFDKLPFEPKRLYTITGMHTGTVRGEHGHHTCKQLLICLHGSIDVLMRTKSDEVNITLVSNGPGLLIGSGIWSRQTYMTDKSALLVLASEPYDPDSYFKDWE